MMKVVKAPTIYSENNNLLILFQKQPPEVFYKNMCYQKFYKKTPVKLRAFGHLEDSGTGVFCKFQEVFKEHLRTTASVAWYFLLGFTGNY